MQSHIHFSEATNPGETITNSTALTSKESPVHSISQDGRRPAVQFVKTKSDAALRTSSSKASSTTKSRLSSPPPPLTYRNRVSFDTFDNRDATDFALTLKSQHKDYAYTARSRTFLCGIDQNDYSEFALEWLLDELVEDGDEVVCLRVVDKDSKINSEASVEEGVYKTEAHKLLEHIKAKNKDDEKSISLILEFAVGKVHETIQRMITIYEPACLIVGTRGRSLGGIQGLLPGSVSKYCLQNSPVPVIVVRPTAKREKKKRKRLADPTRRSYLGILEQSGLAGSQTLDKGLSTGEASETEAQAVAQAIGLPGAFSGLGIGRGDDGDGQGASPTQIPSRGDYTSGPESPGPTGFLSPDPLSSPETRSTDYKSLGRSELSDEEEQDQENQEDEDQEARIGKPHGS